MREDLEELYPSESMPLGKFFSVLRRFWWLIVLGIVGGFYIYFFFFGDNSLSVFLKLKDQKFRIESQVAGLQNENVELQKVIFELKGLEPNSEEKK